MTHSFPPRLAADLHCADERRQMLGDLVGAEAANEREPPRFVLRVEHVDQGEQRLGRKTRSDLRPNGILDRSEEHTSELQSLMRISYAVFCLKKKTKNIATCLQDENVRYQNT